MFAMAIAVARHHVARADADDARRARRTVTPADPIHADPEIDDAIEASLAEMRNRRAIERADRRIRQRRIMLAMTVAFIIGAVWAAIRIAQG